MTPNVVIVRQTDDLLVKTRISLGDTKNDMGFYIVFRGEPENVVHLLKEALAAVEVALPAGDYEDQREERVQE